MAFGKSNNYAENFRAATSIKGKRETTMWTPVIPNSQLIVFAGSTETSKWTLEMLIDPTKQLYIIMLVCLAAIIVIGIVIIVLHC